MELLNVHSLVSSPFPGGVFALSLLLEVLKLVVSFGGAACTPCFIVPLLRSSKPHPASPLLKDTANVPGLHFLRLGNCIRVCYC